MDGVGKWRGVERLEGNRGRGSDGRRGSLAERAASGRNSSRMCPSGRRVGAAEAAEARSWLAERAASMSELRRRQKLSWLAAGSYESCAGGEEGTYSH